MKLKPGSAAPTGRASVLTFTRGHGSPRPQTLKPRTTAQSRELQAKRLRDESELAHGIATGCAASITWAKQLAGRMLEDGQLSVDATYVRLTIARDSSHLAAMLAGIRQGRANVQRARRRVTAMGDNAPRRDRGLVENEARYRQLLVELERLTRLLSDRVDSLTTWLEWLDRNANTGLSRAERRHADNDTSSRPIWVSVAREWPRVEPVPLACAPEGPRSPRAPGARSECLAA